jgi:hypothetical protein
MGHSGEVSVDQAHRGYTVATDGAVRDDSEYFP